MRNTDVRRIVLWLFILYGRYGVGKSYGRTQNSGYHYRYADIRYMRKERRYSGI